MSSTRSDKGTDQGLGRRTTLKTLLAVLVLGLSLGVTGCSDDGKDPPVTPDGPPSDGGNEGPPAVLVAERVFGPQGQRLYYVSVHSDVPTAAVDRTKAIELTSADIEVFEGRVFIRDRNANTITRYKVTSDLKLEQDGEKLSFAGVGLGTGRYHNAYVSSTLAYTLDSGAWRMIAWNPSTMLLTGQVISIDYLRKPALPSGAIGIPTRVGNRIIAPVYWADFTNFIYHPGVGALIIDPSLPAQPAFIEDSRIGGAFRVSAGADGAAYMIGVVDAVVGRASGGGPLPASGILRIPPGLNTFDANYLVDVEDATGAPSVWAIHRTTATEALVQIYDPTVALPPLQDYASTTNFIYANLNTETKTWTAVAELPRGGRGNAGNHVVDGKLYIQLSGATGSESYSVSEAGIVKAFPIPGGDVWHLERIR
jgi:hypothetical protein